jgi:hypothetical protein
MCRRLTLSATAPANMPHSKCGAARVAQMTPNESGEPVISSTSHPVDTIVIEPVADTASVLANRRRNSRRYQIA